MRLLFATVSPARYMAPPQLADEQIMCGPDWPDERGPDGRWRSLRTPVGEYDLAAVLARLPADEQPDAFVALVDASWRNKPLNFGCFAGPKAILVADTHHLQSPLLGMLSYLASQPHDRAVFLYDRHHLGIFQSAGLPNLFWFPSLTFPHRDATVRAARRAKREPRLAFVGQTGKHHPRRAHLLQAMGLCRLPVSAQSLNQEAGLAHYGASLLGFNASLNGDLNLRAFEILASGAALLTDRLAPASGLFDLWTEGREIITYANADELVERAEHALAHPAETAAIGAAGAAWFDAHFNATRRRDAFQALLFDGRAVPEFALPAASPPRSYFRGAIDQLLRTLMVYEGVQELHRNQESVRLTLGAGVPADVVDICATLPRVVCAPALAGAAADMTFFSRNAPDAGTESPAARLWCCDAQPQDFAVLAEGLAPAGFSLVSDEVAVLCRALPPPEAPAAAPARPAGPHVLLYTDDPSSGGVAQYNHSVLTALVRAGYRVTCAQTEADTPLVRAQQALGIEHAWIGYDTRADALRMLKDHDDAHRLFAAVRPDFVIFSDCSPGSNVAARQIARMLQLPYLVVVGFVDEYLVERYRPALAVIASQYAAASAVVAVSQQNLDLLVQRFGLPRALGRVIHYGRPEQFFAPRNDAVRARLRAELGLPADAVLSLTTARLEGVKGFDYQLEAAQQLAALPGGDRVHFAWAGEGSQRAELERKIAAAGLTGRIHLLGHRWDVADWYDAADIFLLPSDAEGMPLSIMEAMAKGLPVAATAVSGIPEQMGETGYLLPNGRQARAALGAELAHTLHVWAGDAALRARLGAAARARATTLFREERMQADTLALLAACRAEQKQLAAV